MKKNKRIMWSECLPAVILAAIISFVVYTMFAVSEGFFGDSLKIFNKEIFIAVFDGHPIRSSIILIIMLSSTVHYNVTQEELQIILFTFVVSRIRFSEVKEYAVVKMSIYSPYYAMYLCKRKVSMSELQTFVNKVELSSRQAKGFAPITIRLFPAEDGMCLLYEKRLLKYLTEERGIVFEEKILPPPEVKK